MLSARNNGCAQMHLICPVFLVRMTKKLTCKIYLKIMVGGKHAWQTMVLETWYPKFHLQFSS